MSSSPGRITGLSHQCCSLTNIGRQSLPTFNIGDRLGFVSDWKAQQMGLSNPILLPIHPCVNADHTLHDISCFTTTTAQQYLSYQPHSANACRIQA